MTARRELELVRGGADDSKQRAPSQRRALRANERANLEEQLARAEALVDALDVIAASYDTVSPAMAIEAAAAAAAGLGDDVDRLRRVIACLAVEGVWMMPAAPSLGTARTDVEVFQRQTQLRVWVWDRRRAVMTGLKRGRSLLRGGPS